MSEEHHREMTNVSINIGATNENRDIDETCETMDLDRTCGAIDLDGTCGTIETDGTCETIDLGETVEQQKMLVESKKDNYADRYLIYGVSDTPPIHITIICALQVNVWFCH